MKPEHDEVIEAMANGLYRHETGAPPKEFYYARKALRDGYMKRVEAMLRVAAERGYRLARIPERSPFDPKMHNGAFANSLHNSFIDAIETIEMEESE